MAIQRNNPYGAFNYLVSIGEGVDEQSVVAGFSDVTGLGDEVKYSDYRPGNWKFNTVLKISNTHQNDDVIFKRGLLGTTDLFTWFKQVRDGAYLPRQITIKLLDEARKEVAVFRLRNAQPKKWVGPMLAAKGGGEVAMEELHVVHEGIEYL